MPQIFKHNIFCSICCICIFSFVCTPFWSWAIECEDEFCDCYDEKEIIDYKELGQYEEMYREFEIQMDMEDDESENEILMTRTFFLVKWTKEVKNWFKKQTYQMLKKCLDLERCRDLDSCAYMVAKFKRTVDKVHDTGDIELMLKQFDKQMPEGKKITFVDSFKERVRYYNKNKKARPLHLDNYQYAVNKYKREELGLENVPVRALIGGVEVACGFLIGVLPFPPCQCLGYSLILNGSYNIYEGYVQQWEEEDRQNKMNYNEIKRYSRQKYRMKQATTSSRTLVRVPR